MLLHSAGLPGETDGFEMNLEGGKELVRGRQEKALQAEGTA